jgi:hypothetical protein
VIPHGGEWGRKVRIFLDTVGACDIIHKFTKRFKVSFGDIRGVGAKHEICRNRI